MYDFKQVEDETLKRWKKYKTYERAVMKSAKGKKKFYFLQGPPYTSGRLHIGHAWNNSLKDIILRYKRMQGFKVWDRAGYDMHGLPTENAVQKKLGIRDKLGIEEYGVEKFVNECIKFSSENAKIMDEDLKRIGIWMDFENAYWPIKNEFIEGEWWLIKRAWEQKRLYKGSKIMHWCASCETSLAKHELEYENLKDNSIFLKFKTSDGRFLVVWTTTPWTIPFNLGVMVNPELDYVNVKLKEENETWVLAKELVENLMNILRKEKNDYKIIENFKGKKLKGVGYFHPFEKEITQFNELKRESKNVHTVLLSKEYVNTESGSGLVHCAPGCGPEDYEVGKENGIGVFNALNEKGIFEEMGVFDGMKAKRDDEKFIEMLDDKGALIAKTKIDHEYATCWRCHKPVVFRATEQWFLKIEDLIKKLLDFNKKVNWNPEFASKNYNSWIENLKDNGITRQRYWGCPVPIWVNEKNPEDVIVIGSMKELESYVGKKVVLKDLHKPWIDKIIIEKNGKKYKRVPDVIDVWVDSGTTSWNCLYNDSKLMKEFFPADLVLEGTEQIRLWFSMLQMCSAIALGKSAYKNVFVHGMMLDFQGTKMSKSLGNVISPYEVIEKYGADVLRYYMCGNPAGENINFTWEDIKIKQRNLNILDNLSNFILDLRKQTKPVSKNLDVEEKWMLSRLHDTIKKVTELLDSYKIDEVIKEIENLYLDLSRVYIKFTRDKSSSEENGKVLYVLEEVYSSVLKMFSIVIPFMSDYLYEKTFPEKKVSVHLEDWPRADNKLISVGLEMEMKQVLEIVEKGLFERDKIKLGLKWPLAKVFVFMKGSENFKKFDDLIKNQLNVKKVVFESAASKGTELVVELDTKQTPELEAEGYARELSRQIQAFRKKLSLEKNDVIELVVSTKDDDLKEKFETNKKFIAERTNATKLDFVTTVKESFKNNTDFKIKDKEGVIYVAKIEKRR